MSVRDLVLFYKVGPYNTRTSKVTFVLIIFNLNQKGFNRIKKINKYGAKAACGDRTGVAARVEGFAREVR